MEDKITIISFYKYVEIENPKEFKERQIELCSELGLKGRILVAREGINGSVAGKLKEIEKYKKMMLEDERFNDLDFKQDFGLEVPFDKLKVIVKRQILPFEYEVSLENTGRYLSPDEFLELYDAEGNLKENILLVDNRNEYEWRVGRFKGAMKPNINHFRDFDKLAEGLNRFKEKKIVMYCTGGIRCEKASAYLKDIGFKDVSQLQGGILTFGKEYPDTIWEGKCFVFDKRMLSSINSSDDKFAECENCESNCDHYYDCNYPKCNKFVALCSGCFNKNRGCCNSECLKGYVGFLRRKEIGNRRKRQILINN